LTEYGEELIERVDLGTNQSKMDEIDQNETPQVWIEKTSLEGRDYKQK